MGEIEAGSKMSWTKTLQFDIARFLGAADETARPWARSVTKIQAFAETASARVIGITGDHRGVGVSMLSRAVAQAYAGIGDAVLLIDASQATPDYSNGSEPMVLPTVSEDEANPRLGSLTLTDVRIPTSTEKSPFRGALEETSSRFTTIIIDLPPPSIAGEPVPAFKSLANACDLVLLVSVTGGS